MSKTITMRVEDKNYRLFSRRAKAESRPLSKFIELAALEYAREKEFADDDEMREIRHDKELVARLNEGSRQARQRRGRFVDL